MSRSLLWGRQQALPLRGGSQGSPSVATGAIHPLLFLRRQLQFPDCTRSICCSCWVGTESLEAGGWGWTSKHSVRRADATCLLGSDPLDHLGQDKSGHSPALHPSWLPNDYQAPWLSPQGLVYLPWQSHPHSLPSSHCLD